MADKQILKGTTSQIREVFIQDTRQSDGSGLTGLVFNTAGLSAYYMREGAGASVAITVATMTLGTWATGGFVEVDSVNLPGVYQIGIPNAALASGANGVTLMFRGAANMAPALIYIHLTASDPEDGVRAGLTALPNAAAGATGGADCTVTLGGTASAGTATSITLAGGSAVDNFYNHQIIQILAGTGVGQARVITNYVGSTKVATVSRAWRTNPDNTSMFAVKGLDVMPTIGVLSGLAVAATSTTITLTSLAVATDNYYNGCLVTIGGGTGVTQTRVIKSYVGATQVATIDRAWATTPDTTSVFLVLQSDQPATDASLQVAASAVNGNVTGSVASVTGAVGSVTGAVGSVTGAVGSVTGNVGGNVVGTVASVVGNVGGNVVGSVASVTGAVGSVTGSVASVVGNVGGNVVGTVASVVGAVGSVAAGGITTASFAAGAIDSTIFAQSAANRVLTGAAISELAQAQPPVNPTLVQAVMLSYMALRNDRQITATLDTVRNDAGTVICKSTLSDDGTTFERTKMATGP